LADHAVQPNDFVLEELRMPDYSILPIGSEINVNASDTTLMTDLCRHGYWPVQYLPGGRAVMRRDLHRLLTREELLNQIG
jgi:hypothetical protein